MTNPSSSTGTGTRPGPPSAARAGGPGVPLSVWPGVPAPCGARAGMACGGPVTTAAAARVIESFCRPGDLVTAPSGSPAAEAAVAAGRRFRAIPVAVTAGRGDRPERTRDTGQAVLAVAGICGHGGGVASGEVPDVALLFAVCERLLRPGGILAVITASPVPGDAGAVTAAARAAGLLYAQHIVLLHAAVDGDRLDPGPAAEAAALEGAVVHCDLLVFAKPGGARP